MEGLPSAKYEQCMDYHDCLCLDTDGCQCRNCTRDCLCDKCADAGDHIGG